MYSGQKVRGRKYVPPPIAYTVQDAKDEKEYNKVEVHKENLLLNARYARQQDRKEKAD